MGAKQREVVCNVSRLQMWRFQRDFKVDAIFLNAMFAFQERLFTSLQYNHFFRYSGRRELRYTLIGIWTVYYNRFGEDPTF